MVRDVTPARCGRHPPQIRYTAASTTVQKHNSKTCS